jgi:hypothetical protein
MIKCHICLKEFPSIKEYKDHLFEFLPHQKEGIKNILKTKVSFNIFKNKYIDIRKTPFIINKEQVEGRINRKNQRVDIIK